MTLYSYRAIDRAGDVVEGRLDASSESAAAKRVQELGFMPLSATAERGSKALRLLSIPLPSFERGPGQKEITALTREFALLLGAGVDLEKALSIMQSGTKRKKSARVLSAVLDRVRNGSPLAEALADHGKLFSRLYINMVRGGETAGSLNQTFANLADYLEETQKVAEEIRSALIYPFILLLSAALSVAFLIGFVLPRFRPLFDNAGDKVPAATRFIMDLGGVVESYWWLFLSAFVVIALIFRTVAKSETGRTWLDLVFLRLPFVGDIMANHETARWSRTLGTLLAGGVPLVSALQTACTTISNTIFRQELSGAEKAVKEGQKLSDELGTIEKFPELGTHLIRMGEETGELPPMLLKTAEIYEAEVRQVIRRCLSVLTPVVTLALGVFVGGIIAAMMMAILSVNSLAL